MASGRVQGLGQRRPGIRSFASCPGAESGYEVGHAVLWAVASLLLRIPAAVPPPWGPCSLPLSSRLSEWEGLVRF